MPDNEDFHLYPVKNFSIFAGFSCLSGSNTDRDLEDFIQNDAWRHDHDRIAFTYALIKHKAAADPLGFVTLQNDAIEVPADEHLPGLEKYNYRVFPAVKIGRLGVQVDNQRKRYGSLMVYLVKRLIYEQTLFGCRFITVDAWRDRHNKIDVRPFYKFNGFEELKFRHKTSTTVPMYFDMLNFMPK